MKQQRQTSKFKAQVVLELLKGETLEELSRKYAVTMAEINTWRDEFIQNGTDGFKRKPEDSKLSRAERKIGQLELEIELIMCPTAKRCKKTGLCSPAIHRHNTQPSDNVSDGKNNKIIEEYAVFCNSLNNKKASVFSGPKHMIMLLRILRLGHLLKISCIVIVTTL